MSFFFCSEDQTYVGLEIRILNNYKLQVRVDD